MIWIKLSRNSPSLLYLASEVKARLALYADLFSLMTWDISLGLSVVSPAWQAQRSQTSKIAAEGSKDTERDRQTDKRWRAVWSLPTQKSHSLHRSSHKACTCLRGRDMDSTPQWKSGTFLEISMGPEILLRPFLEKAISQDCQLFAKYSFTQWPRLCKRMFWENPSLTPPKLISGTRCPRRWGHQCPLLKSVMNHRELCKNWQTKREHPAPVLRWAEAATCGLVPRLSCLWQQGHWLSPQGRREEAEGRVSVGPVPPSNSPQAGCLHPWRALTPSLWSPSSKSAPPSLTPQTCDNTVAIVSPGALQQPLWLVLHLAHFRANGYLIKLFSKCTDLRRSSVSRCGCWSPKGGVWVSWGGSEVLQRKYCTSVFILTSTWASRTEDWETVLLHSPVCPLPFSCYRWGEGQEITAGDSKGLVSQIHGMSSALPNLS